MSGLDRRVRDALSQRKASADAAEAKRVSAAQARAAGAAWRIMFDLVIATALGGALGYGADRLTGLSPLGLLGGLFFGFACGMWMAVRLAQSLQRAASEPERREDAGPGQDRS